VPVGGDLETLISGRFFDLDLGGPVVTFRPPKVGKSPGFLVRARANKLRINLEDDEVVSCVLTCEFGFRIYARLEEKKLFGLELARKSYPMTCEHLFSDLPVELQLEGSEEVVRFLSGQSFAADDLDGTVEHLLLEFADATRHGPLHDLGAWTFLRVGQTKADAPTIGFGRRDKT
jgi:hypothetical protein